MLVYFKSIIIIALLACIDNILFFGDTFNKVQAGALLGSYFHYYSCHKSSMQIAIALS